MIELAYGFACLAMLVIVLFQCGYALHALLLSRRPRRGSIRTTWPEVALIIPCKGLEPELEENLRRHFHHDYPQYRLLFTLAGADDPAWPTIRRIIETEVCRNAEVVIAPRLPDCVEKASNQLAALRSITPDVDVIVCGDSDGLPADGCWLRSLVEGLEKATLVSGFRWYVPERGSFVGGLHSGWDVSWFLLHALGKTVWGGAMAFSREDFARLGYDEVLSRAITDDLALQVCTHRAGEKTGFAPGAMVISKPAERFGDFLRWAVRQSQLVRLVTPWIWLMGFGAANVYTLFFWFSLVLCLYPPPSLSRVFPMLALCLAALYYLGRGFTAYRLCRNLFPDHREKTASLRWVYYWSLPLADLLAPIVVYSSLFSSTIRWRGVSYRVEEGRVVRL